MNSFDYKKYFKMALNKLRTVREPHPVRVYDKTLAWDRVLKSRIFDIGGKEYYSYNYTMKFAIDISIECIWQIIMSLAENKCIKIEPIYFSDDDKKKYSVFMGMLYSFKYGNIIYLFKHCENSKVYLKGRKITDELLENSEYNDCKIVYFLNDNLNLMVMGGKKQDDMMTVYEFWDDLFGSEERKMFEAELDNYTKELKKYLGYTIVKSLTPFSRLNFKRVIENTIVKYPYDNIVNKKIKNYFVITNEDYKKIKSNFFEKNNYLSILSKEEFADSFISSEWLYRSLKDAHAVDLTSIVICYFKAMEQLLYSIILLHLDENRMMNKVKPKIKGEQVDLCKSNLNNINFTINSMAEFYRDNRDVFSDEISDKGKTYIVESIFSFAELRNGFTHKHNIYKWEKVNEIRDASYNLLFLLLGGYENRDDKKLKLPDWNLCDDFSKLCEYVNFHAGDVFFIEDKDFSDIFVACPDECLEMCEDGSIKYSGLYIRNFDNSKTIKITYNDIPQTIWLGDLGIEDTEEVKFNPKIVYKIFNNGKFVGKSIIEEYEDDYF